MEETCSLRKKNRKQKKLTPISNLIYKASFHFIFRLLAHLVLDCWAIPLFIEPFSVAMAHCKHGLFRQCSGSWTSNDLILPRFPELTKPETNKPEHEARKQKHAASGYVSNVEHTPPPPPTYQRTSGRLVIETPRRSPGPCFPKKTHRT